jgi:hypothetical protein
MEQDYETLSPSQYKVLSVLPIPTAILSIVGSTAIIYMVARSRRRKEWTPYKRLLFGMSVCDIILSINAATGNFMRPEATSPRVWAFGNEATCTASGFIGQLSLSGILYNGMLSFYFLLAARFGWKNARISRFVEPLMHVICIGFPLVTAAIGVGLGVFSEPVMGLGCQINDYPRGCGEGPGKNGAQCLSITIAWLFVGLPRILNGFAIILNNLVICLYVWRQARPAKPRISKNKSTNSLGNTASDDTSSQFYREHSKSQRLRLNQSKRAHSSCKDDCSIESSESPRIQPEKAKSTRDSFENDRISMNVDVSLNNPSDDKTQRNDRRQAETSVEQDQLRRLQLVRSQAVLFVGSYFICNLWVGLTSFVESISPTDADEYAMAALCYPLLVLYAIFVPLQGITNMLVYMRPKYAKYRAHFPEEPKLWALWITLTGDDSLRLRNRNKEEWVDPYTPQNQAQTREATPIPVNNHEQTHVPPSGNVDNPFIAPMPNRLPSAAVHSQSAWKKDACSALQDNVEYEGDCIVEKSTQWDPMQNARRYFSSLKGSSLEAISELPETFEVVPKDDRWNAGPKCSCQYLHDQKVLWSQL